MSVFVYIHEYEMTGQSFVLLANLPHDNNFLRHGNVSDRGGSVYANGCVGHGISILIKGDEFKGLLSLALVDTDQWD